TPILSLLSTTLEVEPRSQVTLIYTNRTHRTVMFLEEIEDLKDRYPDRMQLIHLLTREAQEVELFSGRLDVDRMRRLFALVPLAGVDEWFLCGPFDMVSSIRRLLVGEGVPKRAVHSEVFHVGPAAPAPRRTTEAGPAGGAEVTIRLDGRSSTFPLPYDGPVVLEAALSVRADAPYACRGGVCGTCRAKVVEGRVEMETNYALEPDELERGYVLTCQSHPTSERLVLDYDA
ncbi:MAG: 2Fe-2S iron-sulfur cluster-binding protein, partial [Nocardioidaceae bacterium]